MSVRPVSGPAQVSAVASKPKTSLTARVLAAALVNIALAAVYQTFLKSQTARILTGVTVLTSLWMLWSSSRASNKQEPSTSTASAAAAADAARRTLGQTGRRLSGTDLMPIDNHDASQQSAPVNTVGAETVPGKAASLASSSAPTETGETRSGEGSAPVRRASWFARHLRSSAKPSDSSSAQKVTDTSSGSDADRNDEVHV